MGDEDDNFPTFEDDDPSPEALTATPVALPIAVTVDDAIPPLRQVRARAFDLGEEAKGTGMDRTAVMLEDVEGCSTQPAVLSVHAYQLALFFDGKRSAVEVVKAFHEKFGHRIAPEQALDLQNELEKAALLQSSSFEENLRSQLNACIEMEAWPPAQAGASYPADPGRCAETVEGFFTLPGGPGALPPDPREMPTRVDLPGVVLEMGNPLKPISGEFMGIRPIEDSVRSLIVPHIDLRVGGATYAHAYKELMFSSACDLVVVLGVAHQPLGEQLFSVSQKDFQTPGGITPTNRGIARRLHEASGASVISSELTHRGEFSVEFQAMLLRTLLINRCQRELEIVPILCGSVEPYLARDLSPNNDSVFLRFTDTLRNELEKSGRKWCVLCSVDLSHVGPEFGHSTMMDERMLKPLERIDKRMLKTVEALDFEGFYGEIMRTQNSRHVDAVMSVLTMLQTCQGLLKEGRLLHYDQMLKEQTHSAVSYAAMSFRQ